MISTLQGSQIKALSTSAGEQIDHLFRSGPVEPGRLVEEGRDGGLGQRQYLLGRHRNARSLETQPRLWCYRSPASRSCMRDPASMFVRP